MKYIEYPLFEEGYLNRFITTGIYTQPQQFKKAVLSGKVNEWLDKGFSIHENPCRKEFVQKRLKECPRYMDLTHICSGKEVEVFGQKLKAKLYFPFGNIGVEESGFYYTPTYLRSYHYTVIQAEEEELAAFQLSTCGGMTLWLNGELVCDYTPFTRNMVKETTVSLELKKGDNQLLVCHDDLAERDTDYYFRIQYLGEQELVLSVPVEDFVDTDCIMEAEQMLENIAFEKEAYVNEPVILSIENTLEKDVELQLITAHGEFIELMENPEALLHRKTLALKSGAVELTLYEEDELLPAYYYFTVELCMDGVVISRKIGNQVFNKKYLDVRGETLAERKEQALRMISQYGVDNVYKAAALLYFNEDCKRAESIITKEIEGVRKRKDCSDFHFTIILYIYKTFGHMLSDEVLDLIREVAVTYRYWIDEPGDDVMWFFSENHALLFHICQYLSGTYFQDDIFTNSGWTGIEVQKRAEAHMEEWFANFFEEFITEWNSNAYIPVDVLGIATLYNLTDEDNPFHQYAKKALDMVCYNLCLITHKGAVMTSFGRTYEKELKGNYNAGTTAILYVLYGEGYINRAAIGYIGLALGTYEAPEEYRKYLKPEAGKELIFQNTQGFEKHVNLYLFKNDTVLLSTAVGYKPFKAGYQEHIVQAAIDKTGHVFVNHPGESHAYGSGRPNFWAGNGILPLAVQYRNTSILVFDIPKSHRIDYTHAYVPLKEFKGYQGDNHILAVEKDGGYIGLVSENGFLLIDKGPTKYREFISKGRKNTWIIKVATKNEYEKIEDFIRILEELTITREGEDVKVTEGNGIVYDIEHNKNLYVNGQPVYAYPLPVEGVIE